MRLLKRLTDTPGAPGREERVREVIKQEVRGLFDEVRTDAMGNLICTKKAGRRVKGRPTLSVMIPCHMDEIGFYVRHIDEKGFLRVQNAGGFDTRNLFARRVLVQGKRDLVGILNPSGKPIHLSTEEDRKKIPKVSEFYVDLMRPAKEVQKLVSVGDPVTLIQPLEAVGDCYTSKAMDNRVASWVAINAIRKAGPNSVYDIYYVATVQEEVGCRGAGPGAFGLDPDIGVALDITLACDTPGNGIEEAVTELGKGVAIKIMDGGAISHRALVDEMIALAKRRKIPYQLEVLPQGATDESAVQRSRAGRRTITLSVPTRYVHTVAETVHKNDLKAAVDLLSAWLVT